MSRNAIDVILEVWYNYRVLSRKRIGKRSTVEKMLLISFLPCGRSVYLLWLHVEDVGELENQLFSANLRGVLPMSIWNSKGWHQIQRSR